MASEEKKFSRKANSSVGRVVRASFTKSSDDAALELEKVQAAFARSSADASMSMGGMSSVTRVPLMYVDPMLDPVLLMFPKENIKEVNRRMRHYYTYHPIVNNVINLHSEYAISDYELKVDDPGIAAYYNELKEKWDLLTLMINLNRDFWLLGNGFLYGNWDDSQQEWSSFNQYPPENIELHRTYVGPGSVAYLRPDEELKRVINSSREVDQAITSLIPDEFLSALRENRPFMLANSRLIHFARRPSAYSLYGESALKPALKDLIYEDKLRLLQFTFADRSLYPIKHWKVGSEAKGWIPSKKHFDALEAQLVAACFAEDTEVLTEAGFKKYTDIAAAEKLATVNPQTLELSYEHPTNFFLYEWGKHGLVTPDTGADLPIGMSVDGLKKLAQEIARSKFSDGGTTNRVPEFVRLLKRAHIRVFIDAFTSARKVYWRKECAALEMRFSNYVLAKDIEILLRALGHRTSILTEMSKGRERYRLQWVDYGADLIHFTNESMDALVTPNHRMLVTYQRDNGVRAFEEAIDVQVGARFSNQVVWDPPSFPASVQIGEHVIEADDYLRLLGYVIAEGCVSEYRVVITQKADANNPININMRALQQKYPKLITSARERTTQSKMKGKDYVITLIDYTLSGKDIERHFEEMCGKGAKNKRIGAVIKNAPAEKLQILLSALMEGDGTSYDATINVERHGKEYSHTSTRHRYYTSSAQLAADVQEVCLKIGWHSKMYQRKTEHPSDAAHECHSYYVECIPPRKIKQGTRPILATKEMKKRVPYVGKVFCYTMPTYHTLVIRRNGKTMVVGQSNDPDQNIITNPFVNLQFHSAQSHRADLKAEFEFTSKRIMMALFAAENMLGGEASPYATSALNMRIVMHRYLMNRNSLERLLREKVFLPIAKARGLVKRTQAEVQHKVYSSDPKYILPRFFYTQRANLLSTTAEQELMLKLRDKGDIPFEMIADLFGWDKSSVVSGLASEEGTILDPLVKSAKSEVVKASVEARNSLIKGAKLSDVELPKDTAPAKGGRPTVPETEKAKPAPSILPMGDADLSSRSKGQERGTMPKPKEVREEPVNPPKAE